MRETLPVPSQTVHVTLGQRSYEVLITSGGLDAAGEFARRALESRGMLVREAGAQQTVLVVTDRNVDAPHAQHVQAKLSQAGFHTDRVVLEAGEKTKSLDYAAVLYDRLAETGAGRQTLIAAVGGGVIGDLAGFVAATYARGVPYLQVPTSLLAQVDSSVGGKVAVNHPKAKNLIGAFYQPVGVLIDTETLRTLPEREYRCGLAEVVKYGAALDADFFGYLEVHVAEIERREPDVLRFIIARCCRLKADIVEKDEREQSGLRSALNYGHTFAHAFEATASYELLHGEAVAVGMMAAARLAQRLGRIDASVTERQERLLGGLGLPTSLGADRRITWDADAVFSAMQLDKKKAAGGQLRFVLPNRLGEVELIGGVDPDEVQAVLRELID